MVKEVWDSFKDNIKERVSNPFLGTFTLVWVVHNWSIVYAFFYFDKERKLNERIVYFKHYWTDHNFFGNLLGVALITIGVLIATYFFLAISRFLANCFENIIIPLVFKWTKGKIFTEQQYKIVADKVEQLEARLEAERKAKNDAINERESLERKVYQPEVSRESKSDDSEFRNLIAFLIGKYPSDTIRDTILKIKQQREYLRDEGIIKDFVINGLIESHRENGDSTAATYAFTAFGNDFIRELNRHLIKNT